MRSIGITVLVLSLSGCAERPTARDHANRDERTPEPVLLLEEVDSRPIDEDFPALSGVIIADDGRVVSWSSEEMLSSLPGSFGAAPLAGWDRHPDLPPVAGLASDEDGLVAVSRVDGSILRLEASGFLRSKGPVCDILTGTKSLLSTPHGLFGILQGGPSDLSGGIRIFHLPRHVDRCETLQSAAIACGANGTASIAPTPIPHEVLVACSDPSLPLIRASVDDRSIAFAEVAGSVPTTLLDSGTDQGALAPLWFGMPLLRLDTGYVRVVTDLRSDTRRFERWNDRGSHEQTTVVREPLAFVAALPRERLLFGMRGAATLEFVLFRWSWESNSEP